MRYEYETPITERFDRSVEGFAFGQPNPIEAQARAAYASRPIPELPVDQFRVLGGLTFAGQDGSLVRFDDACAATPLHAEPCCDEERPLHLRGDGRAWSAVDADGRGAPPPGRDRTCAPTIRGAELDAGGRRIALPPDAADGRALDWSEACDVVLIAAGTRAWTCQAGGCARIR